MIGSLRIRLLGATLLATGVVVSVCLWMADRLFEERASATERAELQRIVHEVMDALGSGELPERAAVRVATDRGVHVEIYDADDRTLARAPLQDDLRDPLRGHAPTARELSRLRAGERNASLYDAVDGTRWLYVSEVRADGTLVRVGRPTVSTTIARGTLRDVLLVTGALALLLAALLGEYLTRSVGRPIHRITKTADALGRGDFSQRVRSRRRDELGALGAAIDQMADQLVERLDALRREEARIRTILDAMIEGVFVTDPDGYIVLTNAALARLAGDRVEGRTAVEAIRSAELHEAVRRATEGKASEVDFELSVNGERRFIVAQTSPLPDRGGVVAVLHDATELKRIDAVRRDFVANASHELRTPLTSIRGFAETLTDGALGDERMAKRFLTSIAHNAERLQSLVDDLLELSRAESPDSVVSLEEVDVVAVAARVLSGLESRASGKRQQLELRGASVVTARGDARALDQVLLNLVDNAIKYTPDGGRVTIGAQVEGDRVVIEVSDTGPGIPRQHHDRIFERFYRVDKGRSRAQGGTGLGLSIVRHLVERMQGDVSVESRLGKGSTFRVSLLRPEG